MKKTVFMPKQGLNSGARASSKQIHGRSDLWWALAAGCEIEERDEKVLLVGIVI